MNITASVATSWLCVCLTALVSAAAAAVEPPPLPRTLPADNFREVLVLADDNLYIAGQPTEAGLAQMRDLGVTTVVNLRTRREMDDRSVVPFDEAAEVAELGLNYVHIPAGGPDTPYAPEMLSRFAAALDKAEGKVLLHCTVAWRASHLYTAYLHQYRGLPMREAVRQGRAINFGTLPVEGFLGAPLEFDIAQ